MRSIIIAAVGAAALFSSPAFARQPSQGTTSIPDFFRAMGPSLHRLRFRAASIGPRPSDQQITAAQRPTILSSDGKDEAVPRADGRDF